MTASSRFLARLEAWADAQLRAAGVPTAVYHIEGGVAEALVRRACRETPHGGDVTVTLARLVADEVDAHRWRA